MKRVSKENFESKPFDSDYEDDSFEEVNHMKEVIETSEKTKRFNNVKRMFCLCQRTFLHFINNFEYFVSYSVIEDVS